MPKQVGKVSGALAKVKDKVAKAHQAHINDEVNYGQMDLPAGIEGGIAKLVDCRFGEYKEGPNKGQPFFLASGIVVVPEEHKGLRTSIGPEPLCDTPNASGKRKEFSDHWGWVENELCKLGAERSDLGPDSVEAIAAALKEQKPHFRFRTWKGTKDDIVEKGGKWFVMRDGKQQAGPYSSEGVLKAANPFAGREPRVQHDWKGVRGLENYQVEIATDAVEDDTEEPEEASPAKPGKTTRPAPEPEPEVADEEPETTEVEVEPEEDLDALAKKAAKDADAADRLKELAKAAGIEDSWVEEAESWAAVVERIRNPGTAEAEKEEEPEQEEGGITVGYVYFYKPIDPKTLKPFVDPKTKKERKAIEVEVQAVNDKKKTATCKNVDDGKTIYKDVPFDKLEQG